MILDANVILHWLLENEPQCSVIAPHVMTGPLRTTCGVAGEVLSRTTRWSIDVEATERALRELVDLIPADDATCLSTGVLHAHHRAADRTSKLSLVDAGLIAAARSLGDRVLTFDQDLRNHPEAVVLTV